MSSAPSVRMVSRPEADAPPRIVTLDILRGFALLGMIFVHFHQRFRLSTEGVARYPGEDAVGWIAWVGVEQKAWATFAFLFGVGFAVLMRRAESRGQPVVAFYLRRLAALAVMAVALEAFTGFSVLLSYAIWGVPLLFIRRWSTRSLLAVAAISAAAWTFVPLSQAMADWITLGRDGADLALASRGHAGFVPPAAVQNYGEEVISRLQMMRRVHLDWRIVIPSSSFTLFIVGLLAVRHGVFDDPLRHRRLIASAMAFGVASWAVAWWVLPHMPVGFAPRMVGRLLQTGLGLVSEQWLAFTYIGALVWLLASRPYWVTRLSWFGFAGRMALTNYVLQCAAIEILSSPFGLGLHLRPYAYALGALLMFLVAMLLSGVWLSHFRYGPLEWVWRAATYWRLPVGAESR